MMARPVAGAARAADAKTMNAWVLPDFGDPDSFERVELPRPRVGPGHVLLRVEANSVNPADLKIRDGRSRAIAPPAPMVLHADVAGVVEEVGEGVEELAVGDPVYGCAGGVKGIPGALSDFMLADARLLARKPASLGFREAAALPLVALTVWEGIRWKAALGEGDRVLIHGGTGGVGHVAVQVAKDAGAEVSTTASTPEKRELARSLGADHVIDYREETVPDYVQRITDGRGFDLVFDTVGGEVLTQSLQAARQNGTVVSILTRGEFDLSVMMQKALTLHSVLMLLPMLSGEGRERHGRMLREIAQLVDAGRLRPLLDPTLFTFDQVVDAHRRMEAGTHVGKVVLTHPRQRR
jgi:NADPH:quinone reductase